MRAVRILPGMQTERRLTSFSHGAGCGCKLGPDDLLAVLAGLDLPPVPAEVLVAADTGDDAAVYRLPSGEAVVATLDFFTPIVDDPYDWGRIAATNALSDVYAMGGRPFLALNIVSWPIDDLPREALGRVLQGGIDAAAAAGVAVLGGHSITDPEPKYGMVVLGLVDPDRIVTQLDGDARRGALAVEADRSGHHRDGAEAGRRARRAGGHGRRAHDDDQRRGRRGDAGRRRRGRHRRDRLRAARAPPPVAGGERLRGDRRRGGRAADPGGPRPRPRRRRARAARSGTTPGSGPVTDWGELTPPEQLVLADAQTSGGLLVATHDPSALATSGLFTRVGAVVEGVPGAISVVGRPAERHEVSTFS